MKLTALAISVALGVAVAACASSAPASPSAVPTAVPSIAAVSPVPSAPVQTATPATPAPGASTAVSCPVEPQTGLLPSDRMTNVQILGLPGRDVIEFQFGKGSLEPKGRATGSLDVATPPFAGSAGGPPIDIRGEHALEVSFKGMSLQNDVGQLAYDGPREFQATDPARSLRHLVLFDESDGQLGWYVGYDGPSCVTLTREGDSIVLVLDFGPGS